MPDSSDNSSQHEAHNVPRAAVRQDFDTLRNLSVIHMILGAVYAFGIFALFLHFIFTLYYFYNDQTLLAERHNQPLDANFKVQLLGIYAGLGFMAVVMAFLNFSISKHLYQGTKYRLIRGVSFLNCLLFPMGTVVAIWTLRVLGRKPVKDFFLRTE